MRDEVRGQQWGSLGSPLPPVAPPMAAGAGGRAGGRAGRREEGIWRVKAGGPTAYF